MKIDRQVTHCNTISSCRHLFRYRYLFRFIWWPLVFCYIDFQATRNIDSIENIYLILFGTRGIRNYYLSSRYVLKINIYFLRLLIKLRSRLYPWLKDDGFVIRPINHFIMQTTINLLVTYGRVYHQSIHFEITLYLFSNWDKLRWILVNAIQIDMKHKI